MEIAKIFEDKEKNKIYGLLGNINISTNNANYSIVRECNFKETVKNYLNSKKDKQALKMVMLSDEYLDKKLFELTETETRIISLAKVLIENKDYIVLDYFEKGLNYKEKEIFKRLFKKLANEYNKTIIIFTNDLTFIWDISEELICVNESHVINANKNEYLKIINEVDKPEIVKFIDLMKEKNIKIEDYKNVLDLLKAIYRIKGD
ncbi:MAG: hypothetical protein E7163_04565 [Firmicutes bacterium]|nr:hypothetical protein [Bacillota bacterium]